MSNSKDVLRPVLQTFNRGELVACFRLPRLPRGDLACPEWIFAVGELDDAAVDVLDNAIAALTRQPSYEEIMAIVPPTASRR
jgi:hypothetical protein